MTDKKLTSVSGCPIVDNQNVLTARSARSAAFAGRLVP